jgi:TolA-binding protein
MDSLYLLWIGSAAFVGVAAGAGACYAVMSRTIESLRRRIELAEHARNGAIDRSAQARDQIAQLNRAITELRKAHTNPVRSVGSSEERRAQAEQALADAAEDKTLVLPRREALQVFPDTELLGDKK